MSELTKVVNLSNVPGSGSDKKFFLQKMEE
jgi:hypothetical protein